MHAYSRYFPQRHPQDELDCAPLLAAGLAKSPGETILHFDDRAITRAEAALREIEAGPQSDPVVAMGEGPWREIALPAGTPRLQIHALGSLK